MNKPKIYVDGQAGTTGLQILDRLKGRTDLEVLMLEDDQRHNNEARKAMMEQADLVFLCLPDQAAIEAEKLCPSSVKLIDTSTAHRTQWVYGFADLDKSFEEAISQSNRVANPGCHASGMIALIYPLIKLNLLDPQSMVVGFSLTGYTGGGKKMIEEYEQSDNPFLLAPRAYSLNLNHKHIPEIMSVCALETKPALLPVVDDYPQGMLVSIILSQDQFLQPMTVEQIQKCLSEWYADSTLISVAEQNPDKISANELASTDCMRLFVNGNDEQILLQAQFDNLGKGASGAAVQNMNLMLGLDPLAGLQLERK